MYVAPGFGLLCLLAALAAVLNAGFVKFTLNGEVVTGHEFFRTVGLALVVLGGLALAIAYGIWQGRWWTRWAIVGFWVAIVAVNVGLGWASSGAGGAISAMAGIAVLLLLVGWYLFGKQNVMEYFRALERAEEVRSKPEAR